MNTETERIIEIGQKNEKKFAKATTSVRSKFNTETSRFYKSESDAKELDTQVDAKFGLIDSDVGRVDVLARDLNNMIA